MPNVDTFSSLLLYFSLLAKNQFVVVSRNLRQSGSEKHEQSQLTYVCQCVNKILANILNSFVDFFLAEFFFASSVRRLHLEEKQINSKKRKKILNCMQIWAIPAEKMNFDRIDLTLNRSDRVFLVRV